MYNNLYCIILSRKGGVGVINFIWFFLLVVGIVFAAMNGRMALVTSAIFNAAEEAVKLSLNLVGIMCLWLGLMKITESAGVIHSISRILNPMIRFLFPTLPQNHPASGAIVFTLSANLLGLGNAVTPLGIKAMFELQKLNQQRESATVAMCTFLALCMAGFTLVPSTILAIRSAAGAENPGDIIVTTVVVSVFVTFLVIVIDRIFSKVYRNATRR